MLISAWIRRRRCGPPPLPDDHRRWALEDFDVGPDGHEHEAERAAAGRREIEPESPRGRGAGAVRAAAGRPCLRLTCRRGWPGRREPGGGCGPRAVWRSLGVKAAVTACGDAELDDARGARDHDQEHAEDRGEQEGDTERQAAVCAEVADGHALAVFQDEDQQQEQDDGGQRGGDPDSADACPPDDVVDGGRVCRGAWFAGAAVPGAAGRGSACWLRRGGEAG